MPIQLPQTTTEMFPIVNLVRHGRIPDYAMDRYLTPQGEDEAIARGRELAETILPNEVINFYSAPARRARHTASLVKQGLTERLAEKGITAMLQSAIAVEDILENCQCLLDGLRYEPTYAMLDAARWQSQADNPPPDAQACVKFLDNLWNGPADAMGYWLDYTGIGAETSDVVNQRTLAFLAGVFQSAGQGEVTRHIAVTHSGNLRAYLRSVFGHDIGHQMPYVDVVTVTRDQVYYQDEVGTR